MVYNQGMSGKARRTYHDLTRQVAIQVWKRLEQGNSAVKIQDDGVTSKSTALRLRTAQIGFEEGWSGEAIAKKTTWKGEYLTNKFISN